MRLTYWHMPVEWKDIIHDQKDPTPTNVIGVIKSTGWTFENYLNNKSLCRHHCWCNRWPHTDRKLLFFGFGIVLQHVHTSQQGALLFKIILLITTSYEVALSMWLHHTCTEGRSHNIRVRACLLTYLIVLDFTGKTFVQKHILPSATLS